MGKRLRPDWGNTAWAAKARLESIGLRDTFYLVFIYYGYYCVRSALINVHNNCMYM